MALKLSRRLLAVLLLIGVASTTWELSAATTLRGATPGNLWALGQAAEFRAEDSGSWGGFVTIKGAISDYRGAAIEEVSMPVADFVASGWKWIAQEPGFYSVSFQVADEAGVWTTLSESFTTKSSRIADDGASVSTEPFSLTRSVHDFIVTREPVRPPAEIPPLFGICMDMRTDHPPVLAAAVGFHFIRIHPVPWWMIAVKEDNYDWTMMDGFMAQAEKSGFRDFVGNPFGTPKWASTADESLKKQMLYKNRYSAYMPASLDSWENFLTALVERYPVIKKWELWNEPNLPGQSIFWMGSPEEFTALLHSGYEQLKESAPESEVWIGGLGGQYQPFYDRIIKIGAAKSFDILALHGRRISPTGFYAIDQKYGAPPKPWVNSEWHGILMKSGDDSYPSEQELASRMVFELLQQIHGGVGSISLFALINHLTGREREALSELKKRGDMRTSVSGLFRRTPYAEPRFPACVLRNFIDEFSGEIRSGPLYSFGESDEQRVAQLQSDAGPLLVVWLKAKSAQPIDPRLQAAIGLAGLRDWEGKIVQAPISLEPGRFYYISQPKADITGTWKPAETDILETKPIIVLEEKTWAQHYPAPDASAWIDLPDYLALDGQSQPAGFAARFQPVFTTEGLDLVVEVKDISHHQDNAGAEFYKGDSVQFAIDTGGMGASEDRLEFSVAQTKSGPSIWKQAAPSLVGDIPSDYTYPNNAVTHGRAVTEVIEGGLRYRIRIDRSELYPFYPDPTKPIRFVLIVNNNDGEKRAGFLKWADGIASRKDPRVYGTLVPAGDVLATTDRLRAAIPEQASVANGLAVLRSEESQQGGRLNTKHFKVAAGDRFVVAGQWRGTALPRIYVVEKGPNSEPKRRDIVKQTPIDETEWTDFRQSFQVSEGMDDLQLTILCWKQTSSLEVRDFRIYRASGMDTAESSD